jgi:hypothetical protein
MLGLKDIELLADTEGEADLEIEGEGEMLWLGD